MEIPGYTGEMDENNPLIRLHTSTSLVKVITSHVGSYYAANMLCYEINTRSNCTDKFLAKHETDYNSVVFIFLKNESCLQLFQDTKQSDCYIIDVVGKFKIRITNNGAKLTDDPQCTNSYALLKFPEVHGDGPTILEYDKLYASKESNIAVKVVAVPIITDYNSAKELCAKINTQNWRLGRFLAVIDTELSEIRFAFYRDSYCVHLYKDTTREDCYIIELGNEYYIKIDGCHIDYISENCITNDYSKVILFNLPYCKYTRYTGSRREFRVRIYNRSRAHYFKNRIEEMFENRIIVAMKPKTIVFYLVDPYDCTDIAPLDVYKLHKEFYIADFVTENYIKISDHEVAILPAM